MQKISIFTAFLLMLSLSSIAQQDSLSQTNKCQYYYAIEVNGKLGIDLDVPWGVGIAEIHGIQFNPQMAFALKVGFQL